MPMVRILKHCLVEELQILNYEQIKDFKFNERLFESISNDQDNCTKLFAALRLFPNILSVVIVVEIKGG
jgi:hypothetical protein